MPGQRETQATRLEQILEAAYEVALRRGIDGLTVRAVAAPRSAESQPGPVPFQAEGPTGPGLARPRAAGTLSLAVPNEIRTVGKPRERLQALVAQQLKRMSEE